MSYVSRIKAEIFFEVVKRFEDQATENALVYPLEFYFNGSFFFLYKQVADKIYKTSIPLLPDIGVFYKGQQIPTEQALNDLEVNHNAIELLDPLDYKDLLLKHNHDQHSHASIGFEDILTPSVGSIDEE